MMRALGRQGRLARQSRKLKPTASGRVSPYACGTCVSRCGDRECVSCMGCVGQGEAPPSSSLLFCARSLCLASQRPTSVPFSPSFPPSFYRTILQQRVQERVAGWLERALLQPCDAFICGDFFFVWIQPFFSPLESHIPGDLRSDRAVRLYKQPHHYKAKLLPRD